MERTSPSSSSPPFLNQIPSGISEKNQLTELFLKKLNTDSQPLPHLGPYSILHTIAHMQEKAKIFSRAKDSRFERKEIDESLLLYELPEAVKPFYLSLIILPEHFVFIYKNGTCTYLHKITQKTTYVSCPNFPINGEIKSVKIPHPEYLILEIILVNQLGKEIRTYHLNEDRIEELVEMKPLPLPLAYYPKENCILSKSGETIFIYSAELNKKFKIDRFHPPYQVLNIQWSENNCIILIKKKVEIDSLDSESLVDFDIRYYLKIYSKHLYSQEREKFFWFKEKCVTYHRCRPNDYIIKEDTLFVLIEESYLYSYDLKEADMSTYLLEDKVIDFSHQNPLTDLILAEETLYVANKTKTLISLLNLQ